MHKISAHGVHLAVTDVLYNKKEEGSPLETGNIEGPEESGEEDDKEAMEEDDEEAMEEDEGFVLDRHVPDVLLPDLTEDFGGIIQKVRNVVKFFRKNFTELCQL